LSSATVRALGAADRAFLAEEGRFSAIPVWRTNDELCFVVPAESKLGTPNGTEVVLWSPAGSRCLSKDWPESVTKDFLDRDK
jgi:hypothetical protein